MGEQECDYQFIDGQLYWTDDLKFLKDLITNNDLNVKPLDLGNQTWQNGKLTKFACDNCEFKGEIPPSVGNLTEITSLNLHNNDLTGSIPDTISNLTKMTSLYLGHNQLTGTIPDSIGNMINLDDSRLARQSIYRRADSRIFREPDKTLFNLNLHK